MAVEGNQDNILKERSVYLFFNEYLRAMKDFWIEKLRSRKINHSLEVAA